MAVMIFIFRFANPVGVKEMDKDVDHPAHYTQGDIECRDAIRAALTPEEYRGYCKGNIMKYVWREKFKGGDKDLSKAKNYIDSLLEGK